MISCPLNGRSPRVENCTIVLLYSHDKLLYYTILSSSVVLFYFYGGLARAILDVSRSLMLYYF